MTVAELKAELKARGLPVSGKKADLVARLEEAMSEVAAEETPAATPAETESSDEAPEETDAEAQHDAEESDEPDAADEVAESAEDEDSMAEEEAPFEPASSKGELYEFEELPSRRLVLGGTNPKRTLTVVGVVFMLVFGFGLVQRYDQTYGLEWDFSDDKMYGDCVYHIRHVYGDGYADTYDVTNEVYIECIDFVNENHDWNYSYTWWQDARDAEAQAILDAIAGAGTGDGNHSGYVWTEGGVSQMAVYAAFFGQNMSVYDDPAPGDEFSAVHMGIWNGFGGTNETYDDLVDGGASPFNIPGGMIAVKPTGYVWTEEGVAQMAVYATFFGQNMSVYGYPSAGDVFTDVHLGIWNGFGGGNDTFEDLVPGGTSTFNIPAGMITHAPTGYVWSHSGVATMAYYGSTYFGTNMSVYDDPSPGDTFRQKDLAIWNGYGATLGAGNDTFEQLLPVGNATFNVPAGMLMTTFEWTNQTPVATNVSHANLTEGDVTTFTCDYVFTDNQGDNDTSLVVWMVNSVEVGNGTTYNGTVAAGSTIMCAVTPSDGLYVGETVASEIETVS